jgi:hypothetical protein
MMCFEISNITVSILIYLRLHRGDGCLSGTQTSTDLARLNVKDSNVFRCMKSEFSVMQHQESVGVNWRKRGGKTSEGWRSSGIRRLSSAYRGRIEPHPASCGRPPDGCGVGCGNGNSGPAPCSPVLRVSWRTRSVPTGSPSRRTRSRRLREPIQGCARFSSSSRRISVSCSAGGGRRPVVDSRARQP